MSDSQSWVPPAKELHAAIRAGRVEEVKTLLAQGADLEASEACGYTPLLLALSSLENEKTHREPYRDIAAHLLALGADVLAATFLRDSALHFAARCNELDLARQILACRPAVTWPKDQLYGALSCAIHGNHVEMVRLLLAHGADPQLEGDLGLLYGPAHEGHCALVEVLLEAGADPDLPSQSGFTALHVAVWRDPHSHPARQLQVAQLLLERGADVHARDKENRTPLYYATLTRHQEAAALLLRHGADPAAAAPDYEAQARIWVANALAHGCPATFFVAGGMGSYLGYWIEDYGLPVRLTGCCMTPLRRRMIGSSNAALREWIQQHGLPWNSRKPWMREILNPQAYLAAPPGPEGPIELVPDGEVVTCPDGSTSLQLMAGADFGGVELYLNLTYTKLWSGRTILRESDYLRYLESAPPATSVLPKLGQAWSTTPVTQKLDAWRGQANALITLRWGPPGSELAFFHPQGIAEPYSPCTVPYGVLDLQLAEWLPTQTTQIDGLAD